METSTLRKSLMAPRRRCLLRQDQLALNSPTRSQERTRIQITPHPTVNRLNLAPTRASKRSGLRSSDALTIAPIPTSSSLTSCVARTQTLRTTFSSFMRRLAFVTKKSAVYRSSPRISPATLAWSKISIRRALRNGSRAMSVKSISLIARIKNCSPK